MWNLATILAQPSGKKVCRTKTVISFQKEGSVLQRSFGLKEKNYINLLLGIFFFFFAQLLNRLYQFGSIWKLKFISFLRIH